MSVHSSRPILIACEQPLEALLMEGLLRASGYAHVRATSDGREIARLHEKWPFDLLILDLGLSTKNAFQVLSELHDDMESRRMGVLALSNSGDLDAQAQALQAGVLDVFTRPTSQSETLAYVDAALDLLSPVGALKAAGA